MSQDLLLLFATVAAGTLAGLITYFTVRRTSKGTIQTSDATDLWDEANNIRLWLTTEVALLRKRDEEQQDQINKLIRRSTECEEREKLLLAELAKLGGNGRR